MRISNLSFDYNQQTIFNAKCPQIRDADWVCRTIQHTLPHSSTSKHKARIVNFLKCNRSKIIYDQTPSNLAEICEILKKEHRRCDDVLRKKMDSIRNFIETFGKKRLDTEAFIGYNKVYTSLFMTENFKLGNCSEDAVLAELILKMNNVKNACCAAILKAEPGASIDEWKDVDHAVCVFNKDGSIFNDKVSDQTIIIDPWAGKAGFAKDMERYYRNEMSGYFDLEPYELFKYQRVETVDLPDIAMEKLKEKYYPFIFKSKNRRFMQSK